MNRSIIISTSSNPDYMFYAKYCEHAWNCLKWDVAICITNDVDIANMNLQNAETKIINLPYLEDINTATIAQVGRLYAADFFSENNLLMTSDIDLIPLCDYWKPDEKEITIYGFDLTGFTQYPISYIAMERDRWIEVMLLKGNIQEEMKRDICLFPAILSKKWEDYWTYDQQLITKRLEQYKNQIKFIHRGKNNNGLAVGRIDRYDWAGTQNQKWIDAHCENSNSQQPEKLERFIKVFEKVYGKL